MKKEASKNPEEGGLDEVSKEAYEMHLNYLVDELKEAADTGKAIDTISKYIDKGTLRPEMTLEEALEKLAEINNELLREPEP